MNLEKVIILTGMDGSGKTRHAKQLLRENYELRQKCTYVWMREAHFFSLPFMAICRLLGFSVVHKFDDGHSSVEHVYNKEPVAHVWSTLQFIDVFLANVAKIRLPVARGYLLVVDRYVYDILVDLMVEENNPDLWKGLMGNLLMKLIPRDAITIFFDVNEYDAMKRKFDIPNMQYLILRRKYYSEITRCTKVAKVNSSLPYEIVHKQLLEKIKEQRSLLALNHIESQLQNRLQARALWKKWKKGPITFFRNFLGKIVHEFYEKNTVSKVGEGVVNPNIDLDRALQSYVKLLKRRGLKVHTVVVVGSRAKNRWHSKSDIDTTVIASGLPNAFAQRFSFSARSRVLSDSPLFLGVQGLGFTPDEFVGGLKNLSLLCLDAVYWGKVVFDDGFWKKAIYSIKEIEKDYGIRESIIKKKLLAI